mmetsp:Transcript_14173/g.48014  ORF Transcript_14173/g.48014 Transcript_14173/m.48014 type:complete len:200 (+) Transcript_14173:156-755(+)
MLEIHARNQSCTAFMCMPQRAETNSDRRPARSASGRRRACASWHRGDGRQGGSAAHALRAVHEPGPPAPGGGASRRRGRGGVAHSGPPSCVTIRAWATRQLLGIRAAPAERRLSAPPPGPGQGPWWCARRGESAEARPCHGTQPASRPGRLLAPRRAPRALPTPALLGPALPGPSRHGPARPWLRAQSSRRPRRSLVRW